MQNGVRQTQSRVKHRKSSPPSRQISAVNEPTMLNTHVVYVWFPFVTLLKEPLHTAHTITWEESTTSILTFILIRYKWT